MPKEQLVEELNHFQSIASLVLYRPENFPLLKNIDYHVGIEPHLACVSGDHLIVVNFEEYDLPELIRHAQEKGNVKLASTLAKNTDRFGILIADSAGHMITDHVNINYLHAAFKMGVSYELRHNGEITKDLFEMMNSILYARNQVEYLSNPPYITLIFAEIANNGIVRSIRAGHPPPLYYLREAGVLLKLSPHHTESSTPLGMIPSKYRADVEYFEPPSRTKDEYSIGQFQIREPGDLLFLYSDAFIEQKNGTLNYTETPRFVRLLQDVKDGTAKEIYTAVLADLKAFAPIEDDLTLVVIKKT